MKSMIIGGIILTVGLMTGTYFVAGDSFSLGEDYINDLTMLAGIAIIGITVFVTLKYINQIKNDTATGELAEENWDGIGKYKNEVPTGWAVIFIAVILWALWYMFLGYPTNKFSQIGQYNEETKEYQAKFEKKWSNISEDDLINMGQSVFLVQCAPCHGVDAEGINGKSADLTKRISKQSVLHAIENGASNFKTDYPGGMPAGMASGKDAEILAEYVAGGFKGSQPGSWAVCASCHGANGEGVEYVGPNIVKFDDKLLETVIREGKKANLGTMSGFKDMLPNTKIKAVSAYIKTLSQEN